MPSSKKKPLRTIVTIFFALVMGWIGWLYAPKLANPNLVVKWEGLIPDKTNLRDLGKSFNECYGAKILPESVLWRSNEYFSGWSCDLVERPDSIYSLNYNPEDSEEFFCKDGLTSIKTGKHFQDFEISDIEFLENWQDGSPQITAVCAHLKGILNDLNAGRRVLFHCEAGRDRTGTVSALIQALLWEKSQGPLSDDVLKSIECDYKKSRSLKPYKYGRMATFIGQINQEFGSVRQFLETKCGSI